MKTALTLSKSERERGLQAFNEEQRIVIQYLLEQVDALNEEDESSDNYFDLFLKGVVALSTFGIAVTCVVVGTWQFYTQI